MFAMCVAAGLALGGAAGAQTAAGVPAEKQALVNRVLARMALDSVGTQMLTAPVAEMLRQARVVVTSRVPAEKQDAAMKDITTEANKFLEQEVPLLRTSTQTVVQASVAPLLAQKFSVEELTRLAEILESPVLGKFETLVPEMKKTVGENVAKANAAQIQPKMTELQNRVGLRLRAAAGQ
jgi:predicted NBD/HSP70 family sugar kinase